MEIFCLLRNLKPTIICNISNATELLRAVRMHEEKFEFSSIQKPNKINLDPILQNNALCKGVALIVSNNYEGTQSPLPSSDEDSDNMKRFFATLKNYEVVTLRNLKCDEFLEACKDLAALQYPESYRRIVIYFAGHGGDGFITMLDKQIHITEMQAIFDPNKHPKLCNMARIFFIDACRRSMPSPNHTRGGSNDSSIYQAHCKHRNELIAYSTLKGYVAYNDKDGFGGSWTFKLYRYLVKEEYMQKDLLKVLTDVNAGLGPSQTATFHSSLTESILFWEESGILAKAKMEVAAVDIGANEEAEKNTAVTDLNTVQSSLEHLDIQEKDGGGASHNAGLGQYTDANQEAENTTATDPGTTQPSSEVQETDRGGPSNSAGLLQCTDKTETASALLPPTTHSIPLQQSEHTSTTEQSEHTSTTEQSEHTSTTEQSLTSQLEDHIPTSSEAEQSGGSTLVVTGIKSDATSTVTGAGAAEEQRPNAYIVYQNNGNLNNHVVNFANFLRTHCGVNCDTTSYHLNKDVTNWNEYIKDRIEDTEYILLVCTKELKEKLVGQSHSRVEMTKSTGPYILSSTLNSLLETKPKTLPIILEEGSRKYIPTHLQSTTIYNIAFNTLLTAEYIDKQEADRILDEPKHKDLRSLVAKLLRQPEVAKPEVKPHPPDLTRKQFKWK